MSGDFPLKKDGSKGIQDEENKDKHPIGDQGDQPSPKRAGYADLL